MLTENEIQELLDFDRGQALNELLEQSEGAFGSLSDSPVVKSDEVTKIEAVVDEVRQQEVRLPDLPLSGFVAKMVFEKDGTELRLTQSEPDNPDAFNCYLLEIPLTLLAKPGYEFSRIDCQIDFGTERPQVERPIAHAMYPERLYADLGKIDLGFKVSLGENFKLQADRAVEGLGKGAADLSGEGQVDFTLPNRGYGAKQAIVISEGAGTSRVLWRFSDHRFGREDRLKLSVVLLIPQGLAPPVIAKATLVGYLAYSFWTVPLGQLLRAITIDLKKHLERGLPLVHQVTWDLTLVCK